MQKKDYFNIQLNRDINLFKWKSDTMKLPRNPEFYLSTSGLLGYDLKNKRWVKGHFTGILDEYGDFTTFVALPLNTINIGAEDLKNHEDVIVCRNNPLCLSNEALNNWFSELHSENDISILSIILLTRLSKIIVAGSDAQKKQIDQAFKNIKNGLPVTITSSILEELNIQELTDPEYIDRIQYLSGFMGEIDKREANYKGIDLELLDKRAQVTSNELKQYDDITTLDYLIKYEERLRFVEEMRENGYELEIIRNPIFFDEPTKEDINEGSFDIKEEDPEELPAEENNEEVDNNETEPEENNEE